MRSLARTLGLSLVAGAAALTLCAADVIPDGPSAPPSAAPAVAIFDVTVSPNPVQPNASVSITIHTTPNVVALHGRVLGHTFSVPRTGAGMFSGAGNVPWWAKFFHGSIDVTFTASDAGGDTAQFVQRIRM